MLMRWDPFADLSRFESELGRLVLAPSRARPARFEPAVDILEESDAIVLFAEVPGMKADELSIQVEDGVLTLSGERKPREAAPEKQTLHRVERAYGKFRRAFVLPKSVDGAQVDASLKDGVLTIRVPKSAPAKHRIEVKSHS